MSIVNLSLKDQIKVHKIEKIKHRMTAFDLTDLQMLGKESLLVVDTIENSNGRQSLVSVFKKGHNTLIFDE